MATTHAFLQLAKSMLMPLLTILSTCVLPDRAFSQSPPASGSYLAFQVDAPVDSIPYRPFIIVDGVPYAGTLDSLHPDKVFKVEIIPATPVDTLLVTTADGIRYGDQWLTCEQALQKSGVKGYRVNGGSSWSRSEFKRYPAEKIKSIEFNEERNLVQVFTKDGKGFFIQKKGALDSKFLYYPKERISDRQAVDSMISRITYWARFVHARFMNGEWEMMGKWLSSQLVYPPSLLSTNMQGRVLLQFTVNKEGKLEDVKIEQSPHNLFSAAVLKVVQLSPDWMPATYNGEPVSVTYRMPVNFTIQPGKSPYSLPGNQSPPQNDNRFGRRLN